MRRRTVIVAIVLLAGCQNREPATAGNGAAPANAADSMIGASPGPAPAAGATPATSPLVGRWGDDGQCREITELFGNGTYRLSDGSRGHWRLEEDRLMLTSNGVVRTFRIRSLTANRAVVEDAEGNREEAIRC